MERNARFELTVHSFLPTMETGSGHETHLCIPLRPVMSMVLRDIPKLIDEPTVGLDPLGAHMLRGIIRKLRDDGKTVLLTTHYLPEVEELCDRIVILNHGEIVARGTPEEIKGDSATLEDAYISLIKGDA